MVGAYVEIKKNMEAVRKEASGVKCKCKGVLTVAGGGSLLGLKLRVYLVLDR